MRNKSSTASVASTTARALPSRPAVMMPEGRATTATPGERGDHGDGAPTSEVEVAVADGRGRRPPSTRRQKRVGRCPA